MRLLSRYRRDERGVTSVEAALLSGLFVLLVMGGTELGLYYFKANAAEQAARTGARLAATHDPVARQLATNTWLTSERRAGDPLPDYTYTCDGATSSCDTGPYDASAMDVLIHGPDGTGCAESANRAAQGMCDFLAGLNAGNVEITYTGTRLGTAGDPAAPLPLVTVTVKNVEREVLFLERILGNRAVLKPVSVTVMAEDLKGGV